MIFLQEEKAVTHMVRKALSRINGIFITVKPDRKFI